MNSDAERALRQALISALKDPSARAAAVHSLRDATVWAATWPTDPATLRTLTNSNGITALAVFSDEKELEEAAIRYAWLGVDGRVPSAHLHISEVVRFAKQYRAQLVVLDIAADHALELDEGEMELVSALPSVRPPSQQGLSAAAMSSRPPATMANKPPGSAAPGSAAPGSAAPSNRAPSQPKVDSAPSTRTSGHGPLKPSSVFPRDANKPSTLNVTVGAVAGALLGLPEGPDDAMYDAWSHVLRDYPEVEWACALQHTRGNGESAPCVALRIDPAFRKNVNEISLKLRDVSISRGAPYDVVALDAPEQIKQARQAGRPFYPWRKK